MEKNIFPCREKTCRKENWQNVPKARNTTQSADDCSRKSLYELFLSVLGEAAVEGYTIITQV